eukprot:COSAG06_NODE_2031_length_7795_cov_114.657225_5_plen_109_part_00
MHPEDTAMFDDFWPLMKRWTKRYLVPFPTGPPTAPAVSAFFLCHAPTVFGSSRLLTRSFAWLQQPASLAANAIIPAVASPQTQPRMSLAGWVGMHLGYPTAPCHTQTR